MNSDGKQTKSIAELRRTQSVVEYVATALSGPSLGLSGLAEKAIRDLIDRRIAAMRDDLINDLRAGKIEVRDAIAQDDLAGYVLRLHRAAIEGCARRKLQLMSYYFFRREMREKDGPEFLDAAAIIEQLSDNELQCLAIYKAASDGGLDLLAESETGIPRDIDLLGLFESFSEFQTAAQSLLRFGFLKMASGWGTLVPSAQPRLVEFLNNLDMTELTWASRPNGT